MGDERLRAGLAVVAGAEGVAPLLPAIHDRYRHLGVITLRRISGSRRGCIDRLARASGVDCSCGDAALGSGVCTVFARADHGYISDPLRECYAAPGLTAETAKPRVSGPHPPG
jgi:hypothetical protein